MMQSSSQNPHDRVSKTPGQKARRRRRPKLECLEDRELLVASPLVVDLEAIAPNVAHDARLRVIPVGTAQHVQVINGAGSILAQRPLVDVSEVKITGGSKTDTLTVDFTTPFSLPVNFDGKEGADTLRFQGPAITSTAISILGPDSGSVESKAGANPVSKTNFAGVESIQDSTGGSKSILGTAETDLVTVRDTGNNADQAFAVEFEGGPALGFTSAGTISALSIDTAAGGDTIDFDAIDGNFAGAVTIDAGAGDDDVILGPKTGPGAYVVRGGADRDLLISQRDAGMTLTNQQFLAGADVFALTSFEAADLSGGPSANVIDASGFSADVSLTGGGGNDVLIGGVGNDELVGGAGDDSLTGGPGDDVYRFDVAALVNLGTDVLTEAPNAGREKLDFRNSQAAIAIDLGSSLTQNVAFGLGASLQIRLSDVAAFENVEGGNASDTIFGNALDNVLTGRGGNDRILGLAGSDTISGDAGDDTLTGGEGSDRIAGGTNFDMIVEERDADMTLTAASLVIGSQTDILTDIEQAVLTGGDGANQIDASAFEGSVTLVGRGGADVLRGGKDDDNLTGGEGDDSIFGGPGNDAYLFDADSSLGTDSLFELANNGTDRLDFSATNAMLSIDLGRTDTQTVSPNLNLKLNADSTFENVIGGSANDVIRGNTANNVIDGGPGIDTIEGLGGFDTFAISSESGLDMPLDIPELKTVEGTFLPDLLKLRSISPVSNTMELSSLNGTFAPIEFEPGEFGFEIDTGGGRDSLFIESIAPNYAGFISVVADGDLVINSKLFTGGRDLSLKAGGSLQINSDINTDGGDLRLEAGDSLDFGVTYVTNQPINWLRSQMYKDLSPISPSGQGSGMLVDVEVNTFGRLTVSIVNPGTGYRPGETLIIKEPQATQAGTDLELTIGSFHGVTVSTRRTGLTGGFTTSDSGDIRMNADHILVGKDSKLLADVSPGSQFVPGDIIMEVDEVAGFDLQGIANVDTSMVGVNIVGAEIRGGNFEISALANNSRVFFDEDTITTPEFVAEIAGGALEGLLDIFGGVSISRATARIRIDEATKIFTTSFDANAAAITSATSAPIGLAVGVAVGVVESEASVIVAGDLTTTGDAVFQARTDNTLDVRGDASAIVEFGVGVAVSVLNSTSVVDIRETSDLDIGGDLRIQSETIDRNFTMARSNSGRDGSIAVSIATSVENGQTLAHLDGSALVGGDLIVNALQEKAPILGSKLVAIPAWFSGVHAAAGVNTDSNGDLLDDTMSAGVGKLMGPVKTKFINPAVDKIKSKLGFAQVSEAMGFDVGAAVAVVIDNNLAEARIGDGANRVNPGGDDFVRVEGSIDIHARTKNVPDITARSSMQKPPTESLPRESLPNKTKFGGSVALAFGTYDNTARAFVNDGAVVDASGDLRIKSETLDEIVAGLRDTFAQTPLPTFVSTDGIRALHVGDVVEVMDGHSTGGEAGKRYRYRGIDGANVNLGQENYADLNRWDFLGMAPVVAGKTVLADATNFLANGFGVDKVFNTWSQATAASDKLALAGAASVMLVDHESRAYIGERASVNQAFGIPPSPNGRNVSVEAVNTNQNIHFGGNLALPGFNLSASKPVLAIDKPGAGSLSGDAAVGASFLVVDSVNAVSAEIADRARVTSDSLKVTAANDVIHASLNASGSDASKKGFAGTFSFDSVNSTTLAKIDDGAIVAVGSAPVPGGAGESLVVDAADRTILVSAVGGVGAGSSVGVGASIGGNLLRRDTQAVIGFGHDEASETRSLTGSITVDGPTRVRAGNSGFVGTFALAAAVARDSIKDPLGQDKARLNFVDGAYMVQDGKAQTGASLAGDVALNVIEESALAYVSGIQGSIGGKLSVLANNETTTALFAGAASLTLSGSQSSFGLAGSLASNAVISETQAYVDDTVLSNVGGLTVDARQDGTVFSVTAGAAGAPRTSGTAVAGSVSLNVVLNDTLAFVEDSRLNSTGDMAISATDTSKIWSGAGALALGGKAGVGVALSLNMIGFSNDVELVPNRPGRTQAFVDDSELHFTGGGLSVSAIADDLGRDPRIISASASAGASTSGQGNIGGAGTVSVNVIKTLTEAFVTDSIVKNPEDVQILAIDSSGIVTVSGAVGVSQKVSFGAAFGYAEIANETRAFIDNADIETSGPLEVRAESSAVIGGATVGVGVGTGSSKLAAAGSATVNQITNTIEARISDRVTADDAIDGSTIRTGGDLVVSARDHSQIISIMGGASVAAKGVAVGAAVGYGLIENQVIASIEDATVDAVGTGSSIEVSAESSATLVSVALGVGAGAGNFSLGGSVAVNSIANTVDAHIANSPHIAAGDDVSVTATASDTLISVAGGFAAAKDAAVGAAISYSYIGGQFDVANPHAVDKNPANAYQISASIRNAAVSAGDDIIVDSGYEPAAGDVPGSLDVFGASLELPDEAKNRIVTVTVGGAGAQNFALGGSVSTQVSAQSINASVEGVRPIRAGGDVAIFSSGELDLISISGSVAFGKAAIGAVVSTQVTKNQVSASIGSNADVRATGNVSVLADRDMHIVPTAGAVGGASNVGIGGSVVTLFQRDSTTAAIGADAFVTATGAGGSAFFPDMSQTAEGRRETRGAHGVLVGATTFVDILGISVAGGAAGTVGLAGSAMATDLSSATSATIGDRARINPPDPQVPAPVLEIQSVRVFAADDTRIRSSAGALAGSGTVSVGVATDIELISKSTRAAIGTGAVIAADDDVSVEAYSSEDLLSIVGSVAGAGKVAVAGSVAVAKMNLNTTAEIGDSANVLAKGNVIVAADDTTRIVQAAGGISGAIVGAGATVATVVLDRQTNARIDDFATVDALAKRGEELVPTGALTQSFASRVSGDPVSVPAIRQPEATDRSLKDIRTASAERSALKGVAVYATAFDRHTLVGVSAGGGAVDVRGVGVVESASSTTQATIGDGAKINTDRAGAGSDQSVHVAAVADFQHLGIGGTLSVGGLAATPGAEVLVVKMNTIAETGVDSVVQASRNVAVIATANEDLASIATTFAGGGAAFSGAAATIDVTNTTLAVLGSSSETSANNVLVQATDESDLDIVAGSAAVGVGGTGVGGSVAIVNLRKNTSAVVSDTASVNATGASDSRLRAMSGDITVDSQGNQVVGSADVAGLVVQAISNESVLAIAASGSGGAFGGLAGVVNFVNIDADTFATIAADTKINQDLDGAADQSVHVVALDRVQILSIAGALSVGSIGGLAGGVDVGFVRNDTAARIGDGAKVNAEKDVEVAGLSGTSIKSYAASGAAGIIGMAGSVSVYSVGGNPGPEASSSLVARNGNSTSGYIDSRASAAPMLANFADATDDPERPGNGTLATTLTRLRNDLPRSAGSAALTRAGAPAGTSARIGANAVVEAGDDINVYADGIIRVGQTAGAGQASLFGFGGSVTVLDVNAPVTALVGTSAQLSAGDVIDIQAAAEKNLSGNAYAGSAGGLVGLGAQVAIIDDSSTQTAILGSGVKVLKAGRLEVDASDNSSALAQAAGGTFGALTGGASIARVVADGTTQATISESAILGQPVPPGDPATLGSIAVSSTVSRNDSAVAIAVSSALAGAAGADAQVRSVPRVTTSLGNSARVTTSGPASFASNVSLRGSSDALGVTAGGVTVGLSFARTEMSPVVTTELGQRTLIRTGGDLKVQTIYNQLADVTSDATVHPGAYANAVAGSGALAAGAGANATVVHRPELRSAVREIAFTEAGGDLEVQTVAKSKAIATALGGAAGLIGVGSVSASVDDLPLVFVNLHTGTALRATKDIRFAASYEGRTVADATAAAGGIIGGAGATAVSVSAPFVHIGRLGTNNVLDAGSAFFFAGEDASLISHAIGRVIANARGVSAGGLAVGVSDARAEWSPNSDISAITGTSIVAGLIGRGNLTIRSLVNVRPEGSTVVGGPTATATASAGAALVGGVGAKAEAIARPRANIGMGLSVILRSSVHEPGDISISTISSGLAQSQANAATVGGLFALGSTTSKATTDTGTGITTGAGTDILASRNLTIFSRDDNDANATTTNAGAGFAGIAISTAEASVTRQNNVIVRENVVLKGPSLVSIISSSSNDVKSFASADGRGFGAGADATSTAMLASAGTTIGDLIANPALVNSRGAKNFVEIGRDVRIIGGNIMLGSIEDGSSANATGISFTGGAITNSDAEARSYRLTGTDITIRQGAILDAQQGNIQLTSTSSSSESRAQSTATAQQAAGDSDTTAVNYLTSGSFVTAEPGSSFIAAKLDVTGTTSGVNFRTDANHAGTSLDFGTRTRIHIGSVFSGSVFDGTIRILSTTSNTPELIFAPDGSIQRRNLLEALDPDGDGNYLVRSTFSQLVAPVKFVINTPAVPETSTGTVFRGRPAVDQSGFGFTDARIFNPSGADLTIGDLVFPGIFTVPALVSFPILQGSTFSPILTTGSLPGGTRLLIDNSGGSDILIGGNLQNSQGTIEIRNPGGVVRNAGGTIRAQTVTIDAASVGTSASRVSVNLTPQPLSTGILRGNSLGDAFFAFRTVSTNADNPASNLMFTTGGLLDVAIADGTRVFSGATVTAPTSLFVLGMSAAQGLTLTSNQTNITLADVSVPNGLATIFSNVGTIRGLGTATAVRGNMADIRAGGGVGPITTQLNAVEGSGGSGGFTLTNQGNLRVGSVSAMNGLSAAGGISITAFGSLRVEEPVQGLNVVMSTSDQSTTGQDLVILSLVRATLGSVTFNAGDGFFLTMLLGTTVGAISPVGIIVNVDNQQATNADPGVGSSILIRAALDAPSLVINGGPDNDVLNLNRFWSSTNNRPSSFNGQGGNDTVIGPDVATTWLVSALNGGTLTSAFSSTLSNAMTFSNVENLTGGAANDTYLFVFGGRVTGTINGGGGSNFMGYSQYDKPIAVDRRSRTATGIDEGFAGIDSITGSPFDDLLIGDEGDNFLDGLGGNDTLIGNGGNDILTGGDGNDKLFGGAGRDLLFGGRGSDQLAGEEGDDLLVAGSTVYDADLPNGKRTDRATLERMRDLWVDQAVRYQGRIDALVDSYLLSPFALGSDDTRGDVLSGGAGQDWFIGRSARREAREVLGFPVTGRRRLAPVPVRSTAIPRPSKIGAVRRTPSPGTGSIGGESTGS